MNLLLLIISPKEREIWKQKRQEKSTAFHAISCGMIGNIPQDEKITVNLDPNEELMILRSKGKQTIIPYDKLVKIKLSNNSKDITSKGTKFIKKEVAKKGKIGKLINSVISTTNLFTVYITIHYYNRDGKKDTLIIRQEIQTEKNAFTEFERIVDKLDSLFDCEIPIPEELEEAKTFQKTVQNIISRKAGNCFLL